MKWANGSGTETDDALHEARIFLPATPRALYLLASSETSMPAVEKLLADGEAIDQKDNEEMTALALALQDNDNETAKRLIGLGARPDTLVTPAEIPVALVPVLNGNLAGIDAMRRAGIDYSNLKYQGATAVDYAKQIGDDDLLKALVPRNQSL